MEGCACTLSSLSSIGADTHDCNKNSFTRLFTATVFSLVWGTVEAVPILETPESGHNQNVELRIEKIQAEGLRRAALDKIYNKQISELRGIIDTADEQALSAKVEQIEETVHELQTLHTHKWQQLKALLTKKQLARYLLYQDALQRELKRRAVNGMAKDAIQK